MGKSEEKRRKVVILIQSLFCICEVWNYLLISNKFLNTELLSVIFIPNIILHNQLQFIEVVILTSSIPLGLIIISNILSFKK